MVALSKCLTYACALLFSSFSLNLLDVSFSSNPLKKFDLMCVKDTVSVWRIVFTMIVSCSLNDHILVCDLWDCVEVHYLVVSNNCIKI